MIVHVYQVKDHPNTFLIVPKANDFSAVPAELRNQIGDVVPFKEIDLDCRVPLTGDSQDRIKAEINAKGYCMSGIEIKFTIQGRH